MKSPELEKLVLIFDGNCGFCARSVRWIQRRDRDERLLALPSQQPGLIEKYGLTRDDVDRAAWALDADGNRLAGAAAINRVLAELRVPWKTLAYLYRLRPIAWLEDGVYHIVATHRHQLSRLWHDAECAIPSRNVL